MKHRDLLQCCKIQRSGEEGLLYIPGNIFTNESSATLKFVNREIRFLLEREASALTELSKSFLLF